MGWRWRQITGWGWRGWFGGLPPFWWSCVQGSCALLCFCLKHLRSGSWFLYPFCILLFIVHDLLQMGMYAVVFSLIVFLSIVWEHFVQVQAFSEGSQVPGPSFQVPAYLSFLWLSTTIHWYQHLPLRMKFVKLSCQYFPFPFLFSTLSWQIFIQLSGMICKTLNQECILQAYSLHSSCSSSFILHLQDSFFHECLSSENFYYQSSSIHLLVTNYLVFCDLRIFLFSSFLANKEVSLGIKYQVSSFFLSNVKNVAHFLLNSMM